MTFTCFINCYIPNNIIYFNFSKLTRQKNHNALSWKVTFPVTSKPFPPAVFNLQASDWVHCEEETGAHTKLSGHSYKLLLFFLCCLFSTKNMHISKNSIHQNLTNNIILNTSIFTKCNANFKFSIVPKCWFAVYRVGWPRSSGSQSSICRAVIGCNLSLQR